MIKENSKYVPLKKNILMAMIVVPISIFLMVVWIGYFSFSQTIEEKTVANLMRIVKDHRHMIEAFLADRKGDLDLVAHTCTYEELTHPETLSGIFRQLQGKSTAFFDLGVFDADGLHVAYEGPYSLSGKNYHGEAWFETVLEKNHYISDVFLGFRNSPHFIIAVARTVNGHTWVLRATIDTYLFNDLVENIRMGKTGEAYIINAAGLFQTTRRSGGNLLETDAAYGDFPVLPDDIHSFFQKNSQDVTYLYATTWMKENKWLLVVRQEKADALATLRSAAYMAVLICLVGSGLVVGIAIYSTDRIIRRMEILDMEKTQLNQQLIGASRLAEIGEMATGFAHEINNPLQIIKSEHAMIMMALSEISQATAMEPPSSVSELNDALDQVSLQISRCAAITQSILKFGRQGNPDPQAIQANDFLVQVVDMVRKKAWVNNIVLSEDIPDAPLWVYGDPSELQQVLVNLLNNAMDAVTEKTNRTDMEIKLRLAPGPEEKVRIEVADSGTGISPENMAKIFTPFFTTKPVGKGTGLGLSVCFGIIDKMGGTMAADSIHGKGTTFTILLPRVKPNVASVGSGGSGQKTGG